MDNIQYWLLASNILMAFVTFLLVVCTGALVFVTMKYVGHTQKMAEVMIKDYEIKINPIYEIELSESEGLPERLQRVITIHNKGLININLRNAKCDILPISDDDFEPKNVFINEGIEELNKDNKRSYPVNIEGSEIPQPKTKPGTYYFGRQFNIVFSVEIAGPDHNFKTEMIKLI